MTPQFAFPFLADLLMKSIGVLVLAFAVAWLLRHASAANRNAIWSTAFAVLLLLPVTFAVQPRWSWFSRQQLQLNEWHQVTQAPVMHVSQPLASQVNEAEKQSLSALRLPDWRSAIVAVWLAGALFLFARRLVASVQLWRLKRRSISPPARILNLACETADSYQLTRVSEVHLSENLTVPLTWGFWRPVIMLPIEAVEWHEDILQIALRHEYAHVRRSDAFFRLVAQIACAIHWMNPLVWQMARKLRLDQEQAADDLVLQTGVNPITYANELVASVRRLLQPTGVFEHVLAMAQPSTLEKRVNAVLDGDRDRRPLSRPILLSSTAAMLLALAGSALAQVTARDITSGPRSSDSTSAHLHSSAPQTAEALAQQYIAAVQKHDAQALRNLIAPAVQENRTAEDRKYIEETWVQSAVQGALNFDSAPKISVVPWDKSRIRVHPDWRWPVQPTVQIEISSEGPSDRSDVFLAAVEVDGQFFIVGPLPPIPDAATQLANPTPPQASMAGNPLDIRAEHTSVENGIFVAEGSATFRDEYVRIAAQTIRYDPSTLILQASGDLECISGEGGRVTGAEARLEYNLLTKRTKVAGKHRITIPEAK